MSVTLVGMPGAGKSTIGVLLAKTLVLEFVDSDLTIQSSAQQSLQEYLDEHGYLALRALEERVILGIDPPGKVIATGGSAVYSARAMNHLKTAGPVVYLDVPLAVVRARIGDFSERGIAREPGQSLENLFAERSRLYDKWADVRVGADAPPAAVHDRVCKALRRFPAARG